VTAFIGARLPAGWEAYLNPEGAQGVPLSGLQGLGGFTNGEIARTAGPEFHGYIARAFVRKIWDLGGGEEAVEPSANQVGTTYAAQRVTLVLGNVSALDIFGTTDYTGDPRTQFLNWSTLTYGAWDYPADARGYTWGAAVEYRSPAFALRAGRFAQPKESNGLPLNFRLTESFGDAVELEIPYSLGARPGVFSALAFRNKANMGAYSDALAYGAANDVTPDLAPVRAPQSKRGWGVSVQQALGDDVGGFVRYGWNDGKTETYAFTEIDRSFSTGVVVGGRAWGRARDEIGVGAYVNGISQPHRDYLAAGGLGYFLGDGRLTYGTERIGEIYYRFGLTAWLALTLNAQHIVNPGYNRDRGPASFFAIRVHAAF
jgi:carbohydrate-selective porin OprB